MVSAIVIEILGAVTVLFTLRDVFRDIFHPTRSGSLSDFIGRAISKLFRRSRLRPAAGPLALVTVIVSWMALLGIGFAMIYLPLIPAKIGFSPSSLGFQDRALHSLYLSMGSLATFQTFDVRFENNWLKLIVCVEGLVGISMITASVSWLVLVYPALERTRFLAKKSFMLVRAMEASGQRQLDNEHLIGEMADRIVQARIDLVLFPILFNFYPNDPSQTLALALPHLQRIAEAAMGPQSAAPVQLAAAQLREALADFAQMLSERVLDTEKTRMDIVFQDFVKHAS